MKYVGSFSRTELQKVMEVLFGESFDLHSDVNKESTDGFGKLQMLREFYVWDDEGQVESALEGSPCLINLLIEAIPYIVHVFGPEVDCMLAAPEVKEEPQDRVLFVGVHIGNGEGMEGKLRDFLGLFQDQLDQSRASLCIDLIAEDVVAPGIAVGRVFRVVPSSWQQKMRHQYSE